MEIWFRSISSLGPKEFSFAYKNNVKRALRKRNKIKNKNSPVWPFNPLAAAQVSRNESRLTRRMGDGVGAPANPLDIAPKNTILFYNNKKLNIAPL